MRTPIRLLLSVLAATLALAMMSAPASARPGLTGPAIVTAATTSSLTLTWPKTAGAERYEVDYSTHFSMDGKKTIGSSDNDATITGLKRGTFYCIQVRAYGDGSWGSRSHRHCKPTLLVPKRSASSSVAVSVQTFNVCSRACEGDPGILTWSKRLPYVLDRIELADTQIVALQETSAPGSLVSEMNKRGYALASKSKKEMLFYRTSNFTTGKAGNGQGSGTLILDSGVSPQISATWAALKEKTSGATYIFANAHLSPKKGPAYDKQRRTETTRLIKGINAVNTGDLPVVYLGDWNSNLSRALVNGGDDGPRTAFKAYGYADAYERSSHYKNPNLNSGNSFENPPRRSERYGDHVDRIFIKNSSNPEINVTSDWWWSVARLTNSGNYATPWASDHNPVRAWLQMPKPPVPLPANATRLAGHDRFATAAAVSAATFGSNVDALFVANGLKFPDGLSGGPAAAKLGAALLTVPANSLPSAVINEVKRLKPKKIYILGGTGAVSPGVEKALAKLTTGEVKRLAGANRYGTAADASSLWSSAGTVYLASGAMFPDALSGGAAAARDGFPLLLTRPTRLPSETSAALKRLAPSKVIIVGGTGAISNVVRSSVEKALPGVSIQRVGGQDRYETSAMLMPGSITNLMLASGAAFPDALAGVPASAAKGAAFAISKTDCMPKSVRREAPAGAVGHYYLLGGKAVLGNEVPTRTCG